jgi:hypothetical protein
MWDPAAVTPDAEIAVRRLVARYCDAVARFDADVYAGLWTPAAVWETARGDIVGRDAIVATYSKLRSRYDLCVQQVLSGWVEPGRPGDGPGRLRGTWQIREAERRHDGEGVELYGIYRDVCVETPDGWQFERRGFDALYRGPLSLPGQVFTLPD